MSGPLHVIRLFVLGLLATVAQTGLAQDPPLNFANNYFIRGDFTVAGAQGMTSNFVFINNSQYALGTIAVPDINVGIKPSVITGNGSNKVPAGAEVIAAVLYWQTVEKIGVAPGQPGSGQNGFFRPVISGAVPAPGYPISGVVLGSGSNSVSWSSGGCTSGSTGKIVRTYRANVLGAMPRAADGTVSANNTYEVRLPGTPSTTPIAVGATLVLIYRVLNPNVPLNSIVIYDGDYAPSVSALVTTQTMQGFYDAAHNPISRLAHIVGNGKAKKNETVYLNGVALPSPYLGEPPFPGYYGKWDNTVWTFDPNKTYVTLPNPVVEDSASVTTQVVPASSQQGCVSWGAAIVSTTVKNSDGDGLPDPWKNTPAGYSNPGYCDAAVNEGVCAPGSPSWVDLPGAKRGQRDVFVQFDYMCSQLTGGESCTAPTDGTNYSFDPRLQTDPIDGLNAVQKVINAYAKQGITLHVNPSPAIGVAPAATNQPDIHAVPEPYCQDTTVNGKLSLCPFPNVPGTSVNMGVITWPGGFYSIKSQLIDPDDPTNLNDCTSSPPAADCVPRFQPAAAPAKHYVVFGHAVGQPKWKLQNGTLASVTQSGNTLTFTTSLPVGTLNQIGPDINGNFFPDPSCTNGRVTVIGAASNPSIGGTYCVNSPFPANAQGTIFTITVGGSPMNTSYTLATDPNLALVPGFTSTASGVSDVGGANSYISLGLWGNPAKSGLPDNTNNKTNPPSDGQKATTIGGTFIHEFGHANGLAHGAPATYVALGLQSPQSVQINCKPNYQSSMSYSMQVEIVDYSEGTLTTLNKSIPGTLLTGSGNTDWYAPYPAYVDAHGNPIGSPATSHCDGTPITDGAQMIRVGPFSLSSFSWTIPKPTIDLNFDGKASELLLGATDWGYLDFGQIDVTGANSSSSGGQFNGGGGQFNGGGGQFNGGGGQFNGGGGQFNGGGGQFNGGGGQFNGGGEIDQATVNSITRPPQNLRATETQSSRAVILNWAAPFGQIGSYNVYRSVNGVQSFSLIHTVTGNPPATTFTDTNVNCSATGYQYFVTAVLANSNPPQESTPSNTVSATLPNGYLLTGCYTNIPTSPNTPPTITLNDLSFGPNNPVVQGSVVPITWTLQDDNTNDYVNAYVSNLRANSLVAIGPVSTNNCATVAPGRIPLVVSGTAQGGAGTFSLVGNKFTFMWNTDAFCAGSYTFELDTDSGQSETTSALQLQIDVTDTDTTPHITTTAVPDATVGVPYSNILPEDGGIGPVLWSLALGSNQLPPGFTLDSSTGTLHGTPIVPPPGRVNFTAQLYSFTVKVTDSQGNVGIQTLTLRVIAPVSFKQTSYATGKNPSAVISVDFNKDGKPDLAITNTADNTVSILLGNGDGTFTATQSSPLAAGKNPEALAAGDFNGDGNLDLVVANSGDNTVSVFLGRGDGTFQSPVAYTVGPYPTYVVIGDFNGDGKLDVAVANQNDHTVSILVGIGDGTFQPAVAYQAGTTDVATVAAGDFNKDGKLDLATTNPSSDTVSILIGNGEGTFQAPVAYATGNAGNHPIAVTAFDFNGDGNLDLAVTNLDARTVAIMLGNGDGTFRSSVPYSTTTGLFIGPSAMTTGDFDGDGKIDLAITDQEDNTASILLGNSDGTFQSPLEFPTGNFAAGVAAGDFNGDGRLDLAVANQTDNTVSVLLHLPQPPTNVVTTGVTTQVPLAWTASLSTGISGYNVYRATTSGGPYTKLNSTPVAGTGYTDTTVIHGTTYYYVVTALDANSLESVNSNEVTTMP